MDQGLELSGICRYVDAEMHLSDISLTLAPGSFITLLGRTRAGKTTLLRVLAGLDRASAGRMLWRGVDVTRLEAQKRDVAMVYQQFVNYPSLTVYDNIASPLRVQARLTRAEIDGRVREAAALLRIEGLLQRLPAELSGGQQQRTAIARALVKRAGLLLLDEPLANLDYKLREELRSELRSLFRETDAVVVYATAEPSEALLLGGQTAVLHEGRLLQSGATLDVYRAPVSERVGQVFSDPQMNVLDAELAGDQLQLPGALVLKAPAAARALSSGRYRLGVRAHHVRLAARDPSDLRIPTRVSAAEVSGSETLLHVELAGHKLVAQLPGVHRFPLQAPVELFAAATQLFWFDSGGQLVARPEPTSGETSAVGRHGAH